jgi:hypothetical protein
MAYNDGVIDEANFINLSNECVGKGILPTGKMMFELSQAHAKQQVVVFQEWASVEGWSYHFSINGGIWVKRTLDERKNMDREVKNTSQLYDLFLQSQNNKP